MVRIVDDARWITATDFRMRQLNGNHDEEADELNEKTLP